MQTIIFDTDVLINWLTQETESITRRKLWEAPLQIIERVEAKEIRGCVSLLSLLEIRFLLNRKFKHHIQDINKDISLISGLFDVLIPDETELLRANKLQEKYLLDPFDAVFLATVLSMPSAVLVSRDKKFLAIASRFTDAMVPEKVSTLKPRRPL